QLVVVIAWKFHGFAMSDSESTKFSCCNKICNYYVCRNCLKIIHKGCLHKIKNKRFVSNNIIQCCTKNNDIETCNINLSTELLQANVDDLTHELTQKNSYINKIKTEFEQFKADAFAMEIELNKI